MEMRLLTRVLLQNGRRLFSTSSESHFLESVNLLKRGGIVDAKEYRDKAILIYFSAGWCTTCKEFTPMLKKFYENGKDEGLEVVWISRDRSADDQLEYYENSLPAWPYVQFGTKDIRSFLQLFKIKTIPSIKMVDKEGHVVDDGARIKIEKAYADPEATKKVVQDWKKAIGV